MTEDGPIRSVVVAGGGISAWSAAAALKRRIPLLDVTLLSLPVPTNALADRMISTLPSIVGFHGDIGLADEDTVTRAASGIRLGTLFDGWAEGLRSYVHAYGPCGAPVDGVPFHELWMREHGRAGLPPFESFSPAAELARTAHPLANSSSDLPYGLQLSLDRYAELMRAYALHLGVSEQHGVIVEVPVRSSDGFIERLSLDGARHIEADLFVDASGPAALLHSRMASQFIDWSEWLHCDRLLMSSGSADPTAIAMDRVTATPVGWKWAASAPRGASNGLVYSSAKATDERIEREFPDRTHDTLTIQQGRRESFWVHNCVAIGDAAVMVEPLEWTNLHLAHSQIDRMIAMMPGRDCAEIELAEFNRQCAAEADRVRDFVCLHYVCARRSEPFWTDAASVEPPASLAHTLEQFAERGRLPFYEEETFSRDSWLAVLFGQGFEPRKIDPLADLVPPERAAHALRAMRRSIERSPASLPTSTLIDLNPRGVR